MDQENAIEVRDMYKSFKIQSDKASSIKDFFVRKRSNEVKRVEVLKDINLDIEKGETVCLIGTNGSGKSTLLKLMTRIIYPNKGTVKTFGKVASLLELGAGFHPDFTGRENIYFNSAIFGLTHEEIEKKIDDIISFSELGSFIDEPIRTYSSGMYMRLAFSIAINVEAEILLIDEILAVGDQYFQDKCFAKLRELKNQKDKTIVIVSHSLETVKELCDRAIWIYKGEVKLDGDPTYVIAQYLEQIAIDHKMENEKAIQEGRNVQVKSVLFLESPKDYIRVKPDDRKIKISGWKLCDYEKAELKVFVGEKQIETLRYNERKDVMMIYSDQYGGLVDEKTVGWNAKVDLSNYLDQAEDDGTLRIYAKLMKDANTELASKMAIIILEKE